MDNAVFDRANKFFENHTFEVYTLFDSEGEPIAPTNVKVKLTGVKDYISMLWKNRLKAMKHGYTYFIM